MVEQVIFKIDKKLKEQAMKKAKREGIAFSAVLKSATQAYVEDEFEVGLVYSPKLIRDVRAAQKEIREGKGLRGNLGELLKRV
ncbi:MAG: hypothetical protein EXS69_00630 [Candidatus Zambryskibacteria bacterium]|nr:hypothetical protein [Candidatus Zambryskibacteria bacterium]